MLYLIKQLIKKALPPTYYKILKNFYLIFRGIFYFGNQFECPICCRTFRSFIPFGGKNIRLMEMEVVGAGYRNCLCPRCDSLDRIRLVWLYIKLKTDFFSTKHKKVLHIAPEPQLEKLLSSAPMLQYISADILPGVAMFQMDITNIPYEDNYFDVIICNHVLEHIYDDSKAMQELFRVLSPGGWAIIQVPISHRLEKSFEDLTIQTPLEREKVFGQQDHIRIYGKDYEDRLRNIGFNVSVHNLTKEIGKERAKRYGLILNENLYFCTKS